MTLDHRVPSRSGSANTDLETTISQRLEVCFLIKSSKFEF